VKALLPFLLALAFAAPAQAIVQPVSLATDFPEVGLMHTLTVVLYDGVEAQELRHQLDANGDGVIDGAEVHAFEREYGSTTLPPDSPTLDLQKPFASNMTIALVGGAIGSANATAPVTLVAVTRLWFNATAARQHTLFTPQGKLKPNAFPGNFSGSITAPPGFQIQSYSGLPLHSKISDDKRTVSFTSQSGAEIQRATVLTFERQPQSSSTSSSAAAFGWPEAAVVIGGAGLAIGVWIGRARLR